MVLNFNKLVGHPLVSSALINLFIFWLFKYFLNKTIAHRLIRIKSNFSTHRNEHFLVYSGSFAAQFLQLYNTFVLLVVVRWNIAVYLLVVAFTFFRILLLSAFVCISDSVSFFCENVKECYGLIVGVDIVFDVLVVFVKHTLFKKGWVWLHFVFKTPLNQHF